MKTIVKIGVSLLLLSLCNCKKYNETNTKYEKQIDSIQHILVIKKKKIDSIKAVLKTKENGLMVIN